MIDLGHGLGHRVDSAANAVATLVILLSSTTLASLDTQALATALTVAGLLTVKFFGPTFELWGERFKRRVSAPPARRPRAAPSQAVNPAIVPPRRGEEEQDP